MALAGATTASKVVRVSNRTGFSSIVRSLLCTKPVTSLLLPQIHKRLSSFTRGKQFSETAISTTLMDGGKVLHLSSEDKGLEMHAVWLRHNCQCPECVSSSGQKTIDPEMLDPSTIAISSVELSELNLNIKWSCGHRGYIDVRWLNKFVMEKDCELLVAETLPRVSAEEVLSSDTGKWRWLKNLNEYGLCLLTGLPAQKGEVDKLGSTIYELQETVYGRKFDVLLKENPENIAYTTSALSLHQDLVYYESPPGIQILHCLRNDECVEGGLSILLDSYPVLEELRSKHPQHFETLTKVPATFQKQHFERAKPVWMQYQRPHIVLDKDDKIVAFTWAPQFEGASCLSKEEVVPYYEAYSLLAQMFKDSPLKLFHKFVPGDVVTFSNRRVLHGRTEIHLNGGTRLLEGAYVNIDEFKSRFQVLCAMLGYEDYPVKRVFNQCSY